jgi:hypothetical protein
MLHLSALVIRHFTKIQNLQLLHVLDEMDPERPSHAHWKKYIGA